MTLDRNWTSCPQSQRFVNGFFVKLSCVLLWDNSFVFTRYKSTESEKLFDVLIVGFSNSSKCVILQIFNFFCKNQLN